MKSKKSKKDNSSHKIAINGFGRIGKQFLLASLETENKNEYIINDLCDIESLAYSLKFDSVHKHKHKIEHDKNHLIVNGKKIKVISERDATKLPWKNEKVDLVVECTGFFTEREKAMLHIKAGAKKVLISAPAKDHDITIVYGVNDSHLSDSHKIISAASCTTNCVTPMLKIINDAYKIRSAYFITTHAYTSTQKIVDTLDQKDPRRGRAAAQSIIPSTSGASKSVIEALPELNGKLLGYALRVPVPDGSITSLIAQVDYRPDDAKQLNLLFKKKSQEMKNVLDYTDEFIVSQDIIGNSHSCIFDSSLTQVQGNHVSVSGWYDNEYGYSHRLADVAKLILSKG
jgi:glyceraldehyde 3-phosphate dehydrogenase